MLTGLTEQDAAARLAVDGPNELPHPERRDFWRICWGVLREPMFALLVAGGLVYVAVGELKDAAVLVAFAMLSVGIAVVQELRSEKVLSALRDLSSPTALVIRGGVRRQISGRDLVCGDLLVLSEGDRVPADCLAVEASDLQSDESLLSGESAPVSKIGLAEPGALVRPGGEKTTSIYAGALVVRGSAVARVAATGERTEMGRIGKALQSIVTGSPRLTLEVRKIVQVLGWLAFLVCAGVLLILGLGRGQWLEGLLGGVAVGMAMIPEEFPLVLTVFMVMGAWRISRAGVLTRKASAIETLGSATVLCTDKTGTLTENRMAVAGGWLKGRLIETGTSDGPNPDLSTLARVGSLASAISPFDPMERALQAAAGEDKAPDDWSVVKVYGLRPDLLAVTQVWAAPNEAQRIVAAKGAPEAIADLCGLSPSLRADMLKAVEALAGRGMRVLGLAEGRVDKELLPETPRGFELQFVGLVGLADPVRKDAPDAVRACRDAGIRVVMITGDYPATARAIADQAGLEAGQTMTGSELAALNDDELKARAGSITVFARILPEQKLRIVHALKAAGQVVAMTGDGVNDAPALKAADIGVAMGERGSDVAREAASLVLLKDGFGAIPDTIRLGRRIYENLRHSMSFILAVHLPIAGLALVPLLTGGGIVLGPIHISFLEMFIDPVCAVAFEAEPDDPSAMKRPPRDPAETLFSKRSIMLAVSRGTVGLLAVLLVYAFAIHRYGPTPATRATTFAALVLTDIALVIVSRVSGHGLREALSRRNPLLWGMVAALLVVLGLALFTPAGESLFDFAPIDPPGIYAAVAAGFAVLAVCIGIDRARGWLPLRRPIAPAVG